MTPHLQNIRKASRCMSTWRDADSSRMEKQSYFFFIIIITCCKSVGATSEVTTYLSSLSTDSVTIAKAESTVPGRNSTPFTMSPVSLKTNKAGTSNDSNTYLHQPGTASIRIRPSTETINSTSLAVTAEFKSTSEIIFDISSKTAISSPTLLNLLSANESAPIIFSTNSYSLPPSVVPHAREDTYANGIEGTGTSTENTGGIATNTTVFSEYVSSVTAIVSIRPISCDVLSETTDFTEKLSSDTILKTNSIKVTSSGTVLSTCIFNATPITKAESKFSSAAYTISTRATSGVVSLPIASPGNNLISLPVSVATIITTITLGKSPSEKSSTFPISLDTKSTGIVTDDKGDKMPALASTTFFSDEITHSSSSAIPGMLNTAMEGVSFETGISSASNSVNLLDTTEFKSVTNNTENQFSSVSTASSETTLFAPSHPSGLLSTTKYNIEAISTENYFSSVSASLPVAIINSTISSVHSVTNAYIMNTKNTSSDNITEATLNSNFAFETASVNTAVQQLISVSEMGTSKTTSLLGTGNESSSMPATTEFFSAPTMCVKTISVEYAMKKNTAETEAASTYPGAENTLSTLISIPNASNATIAITLSLASNLSRHLTIAESNLPSNSTEHAFNSSFASHSMFLTTQTLFTSNNSATIVGSKEDTTTIMETSHAFSSATVSSATGIKGDSTNISIPYFSNTMTKLSIDQPSSENKHSTPSIPHDTSSNETAISFFCNPLSQLSVPQSNFEFNSSPVLSRPLAIFSSTAATALLFPSTIMPSSINANDLRIETSSYVATLISRESSNRSSAYASVTFISATQGTSEKKTPPLFTNTVPDRNRSETNAQPIFRTRNGCVTITGTEIMMSPASTPAFFSASSIDAVQPSVTRKTVFGIGDETSTSTVTEPTSTILLASCVASSVTELPDASAVTSDTDFVVTETSSKTTATTSLLSARNNTSGAFVDIVVLTTADISDEFSSSGVFLSTTSRTESASVSLTRSSAVTAMKSTTGMPTASSRTIALKTTTLTTKVMAAASPADSTSMKLTSTTVFSIPSTIPTTLLTSCTQPNLSIKLEKVNSKEIQFSWNYVGGQRIDLYNVSLQRNDVVEKMKIISDTWMMFGDLLPSYQYVITVETLMCTQKIYESQKVWTDGKNFKGRTKITNELYKPGYANKSSPEFQDFAKNFNQELRKLVPPEIQTLFASGQMRVELISLLRGSILVNFNIVMGVEQNLTLTSISETFIEALNRSTALKVDLRNTVIEVRNSCMAGLNGCSDQAACTAEEATYSCACLAGFTDLSPLVPGRICKDINECDAVNKPCSVLAQCTNTIGSYSCQCYPGIKDDNTSSPGRQCKDSVTCFNSTSLCLENNNCLSQLKYLICSYMKVFACSFSFKKWTFAPALYNPDSPDYTNMSSIITTDLAKEMRARLKDATFNTVMVAFRPGSVRAYFLSLTDGQAGMSEQQLQVTLSAAVSAMLHSETKVTVQAIHTSMTVNLLPSSTVSEKWKLTVIILGVLMGAVLLFIVIGSIMYLFLKKKYGNYSTRAQGLMGNFSYTYI